MFNVYFGFVMYVDILLYCAFFLVVFYNKQATRLLQYNENKNQIKKCVFWIRTSVLLHLC
jgi:hypothetical protein